VTEIQYPPNTAGTEQLGLGAFFEAVSELGKFPVSKLFSPGRAHSGITQAVGQQASFLTCP